MVWFNTHMDHSFRQSDSLSFKKQLIMNSNDKNVSKERPDFCITDLWGRVLLKSEIKHNFKYFQLAINEVNKKNYVTNTQFNLSGSFAIICAGNTFQLHFLTDEDFICKPNNMILFLNFDDTKQRIDLVTKLICLCYLIELILNAKSSDESFFFLNESETFEKESGKLISKVKYLPNNQVHKKVSLEWIENKNEISINDYLDKLIKFYSKFEKLNKFMKFQNLYIDRDYLHIISQPICQTSVKLSIKNLTDFKVFFGSILESAQSLHNNGYIHGDIGRSRIVNDIKQSKYQFIDFENIQEICTKPCSAPKKNNKHV